VIEWTTTAGHAVTGAFSAVDLDPARGRGRLVPKGSPRPAVEPHRQMPSWAYPSKGATPIS